MAAHTPSGVISRRELAIRFLQLAAALATTRGLRAENESGPHAVVVDRDVMVRMRDGVRLATDVYRPAGTATPALKLPTILERTPYGKSQLTERHASIEVAKTLASHGYAVVYQDCRGRGRSEVAR